MQNLPNKGCNVRLTFRIRCAYHLLDECAFRVYQLAILLYFRGLSQDLLVGDAAQSAILL